jgi:hypothetical protein
MRGTEDTPERHGTRLARASRRCLRRRCSPPRWPGRDTVRTGRAPARTAVREHPQARTWRHVVIKVADRQAGRRPQQCAVRCLWCRPGRRKGRRGSRHARVARVHGAAAPAARGSPARVGQHRTEVDQPYLAGVGAAHRQPGRAGPGWSGGVQGGGGDAHVRARRGSRPRRSGRPTPGAARESRTAAAGRPPPRRPGPRPVERTRRAWPFSAQGPMPSGLGRLRSV